MTDLAHELETLCRACGFCCDGTLFQRALLEPDEVEPAKRRGLKVFEARGFSQPCTRIEAYSCTIYPDRPSVCRSFECRLLARQRTERGPLEPMLANIARVRELRATLDKHGLDSSEDDVAEAHAELMERIERDFSRAR
jgi:Fe-S-cluster containining protein